MVQMLKKEAAEKLLEQAIKEIKEVGEASQDIVINKRKKTTEPNIFLIEVGVRRNIKSVASPSNSTILRVNFNDNLIKLVDEYSLAIAK